MLTPGLKVNLYRTYDVDSNMKILQPVLEKRILVKCTVQLKHSPSCYSQTNVFISVFILCGNPDDIVTLKSKVDKINEEILFILLDIYK